VENIQGTHADGHCVPFKWSSYYESVNTNNMRNFLLLNMEWLMTRMKDTDRPAEALQQTHERHARQRKSEDKLGNNEPAARRGFVKVRHATSAGTTA
jgi:hypothetical protein